MDFTTPQVPPLTPGSLVGFNGGTILGAEVQSPCRADLFSNRNRRLDNGFSGIITPLVCSDLEVGGHHLGYKLIAGRSVLAAELCSHLRCINNHEVDLCWTEIAHRP